MAPERKLSKGTKRAIREQKASIRKEFGVGDNHIESEWQKIENALQRDLANWREDFAPHNSVLKEFYALRRQIVTGDKNQGDISGFQDKHKELIPKLSPALRIIRDLTTLK